ncbi:unnamed protein product [Rhodiola kirilowii]
MLHFASRACRREQTTLDRRHRATTSASISQTATEKSTGKQGCWNNSHIAEEKTKQTNIHKKDQRLAYFSFPPLQNATTSNSSPSHTREQHHHKIKPNQHSHRRPHEALLNMADGNGPYKLLLDSVNDNGDESNSVRGGQYLEGWFMKPSSSQLWRFSSVIVDQTSVKPSAPKNSLRRSLNPLPIPNRTILEPKGQDLDFINVAHSHLLHSDWEKLESLSSGLTHFRVQHILLKIHKDYVLSLEFFNWVSTKNPNFLSLDTHSAILHILTKHRKFKSAEAIIRRLLNSGNVDLLPKLFDSLVYSYRMCQSSHNVFDSLFKTCAHLKKFRNATDTFFGMKEYGFLPNVESCNAYLSSMIKMKRPGMALWFYGEMRKCRISPNIYTLNMVMCSFCQLGELDRAIEVLDGMGKMGFKPSAVSYGTLISGYLSKGLVNSALKLKNEMVKNGVDLGVEVYNALINGLCNDGKVPMACRMFTEMKAGEVTPNVVTYNTLINGYGRDGKIEMALKLFEEMGKKGLKADILTYNALISGLCKDGKTKKGAFLVRELDKAGLSPNASTFSALIYGQCLSNKPDRGLQLLKSMIRSGCCPNYETFETLITSFCKSEDFDGVVQVLKVMKESMALSSANLGRIFSRLCGEVNDQLALKLYKEIQTKDVLPDGFDITKVITGIPE